MRRRHGRVLGLAAAQACVLGLCAIGAGAAQAQSEWILEQPPPPPPEAGVPPAPQPVGLGHIGDIEFAAPNRGVLITAGNPRTVPAGVWIYNGTGWRELSTVCGGTDGRIAWAGPESDDPGEGEGAHDASAPDEFWTISNGRAGQAEVNGERPPLIDDTLCRFAVGATTHRLEVVESFAAPAFEARSYQQMHAAACLGFDDCWFAGDPLPEQSSEIGAFQLHWNGSSLSEDPYPNEAHAIWDMRAFERSLFESVQMLPDDEVLRHSANPPVLHVLDTELPGGWAPEPIERGKLYPEGGEPSELDYLHLSAGSGALWAAAGKRAQNGAERENGEEEQGAQLTVVRYTPEAGGQWEELLGPEREAPPRPPALPGETVEAIAAEGSGGEEGAWLALQTVGESLQTEREQREPGTPNPSSFAEVVRVAQSGERSAPEVLSAEGHPRGAADQLTCPAPGDCWLATTTGWLFHYAPAGGRTLPQDASSHAEGLITERPPDQGVPQTLPDSVPIDNSGASGEIPELPSVPAVHKAQEEVRVPVALVSSVHVHLRHGTTLELRFHLAVKARIQLVAKRKHHVVAKTSARTFSSGEHELLLRLDRRRWPTELHLVEHALAPLPTVSTLQSGSESVTTTSLAFPAHLDTTGPGLP